MTYKTAKGFTLVEIMICVSIIGILASIAYPSYNTYIVKNKRSEGRSALLKAMQDQERHYTNNGTYATFTSGQNISTFKTYSGETSSSSAYFLKAENCPAVGDVTPSLRECIKLTATPNNWSDTQAGNLVLISTGLAKSCTGTTSSVCWP